LDFGFTTVVGRFALEPGATATMVSPSWLRTQGVVSALFTHRKVAARDWAFWAKSGRRGVRRVSGSARPLFVFETKVGGVPVELKGVLPVETVLARDADGDPVCCDGILGRDFFEQFRVRLDPGPAPAAILEDPRVALTHEETQQGRWVELRREGLKMLGWDGVTPLNCSPSL
jgi:hypothetical protein